MSLLDSTIKFLRGESKRIDPPNEYCPNCWGRQEYEGQYFDAVYREHIDLNNVTNKKGWIQAYATEHLEGIKLISDGELMECKTCDIRYRPSDR